MSKSLKYTFLIHSIVGLIMGLGLLAAPGRWLDLFGWAPVDPLISRMFGAALLAMAWSSFRAFRVNQWDQVELLVELEAAFTTLAAVGLLRHLLVASWPWYVWTTFIVLALFAVAWIYHLVKHN